MTWPVVNTTNLFKLYPPPQEQEMATEDLKYIKIDLETGTVTRHEDEAEIEESFGDENTTLLNFHEFEEASYFDHDEGEWAVIPGPAVESTADEAESSEE